MHCYCVRREFGRRFGEKASVRVQCHDSIYSSNGGRVSWELVKEDEQHSGRLCGLVSLGANHLIETARRATFKFVQSRHYSSNEPS